MKRTIPGSGRSTRRAPNFWARCPVAIDADALNLMKIVLVVAAILAGACAIESRAPVGVVLITLDTARADRLSPYGFGDATRDLLERAIVIVTADHGESLGEHREMDRGTSSTRACYACR